MCVENNCSVPPISYLTPSLEEYQANAFLIYSFLYINPHTTLEVHYIIPKLKQT